MRKQLFFFSLLTLTACGQNQTQSSETKALVSRQQAERAFDLVAGINYLPFTFIIDGCYARSLYMSMELASEGIPSSAHYVNGYLQPTPDVSWSYHVAPLLQLKDSTQEPWILDPAFESEPLTRTEWINKDFAAAKEKKIPLTTIAQATTRVRAGSAYFTEGSRVSKFDSPKTSLFSVKTDSNDGIVDLTPKPINKSLLIPDFKDMPTFLSSDIHSACSIMHDYIENEDLGEPDPDDILTPAEKKQLLLTTATTRLIKSMQQVGKLTKDGLSVDGSRDGQAACKTAMAGYYR